MSDKLISLESALKEIRRFKGYIDDDMIERFSIAFKRLPAVPQEMSAREFLRTLQRKADAENLITVMKFVGNDWSTPPAFGKWVEDTEKWAHEHPETDMMTAKYALPKIDFEEGAKNETNR